MTPATLPFALEDFEQAAASVYRQMAPRAQYTWPALRECAAGRPVGEA